MKEDILEQLVEDWFVSKPGWFVKHNIKFRPNKTHKDYQSKKDSVHSDIDILAFSKYKEVSVVTCKSWQSGFNPKDWLNSFESDAEYNENPNEPRESWKYFREIISDKWIQAFIDKIENETGERNFTYYIAITKLKGNINNKKKIENSEIIKKRFKNYNSRIEIKFITLEEIIIEYNKRILLKLTPSLESTDVGRFLQLINAADLEIKNK